MEQLDQPPAQPVSRDASQVDYTLVPQHLRIELLTALQRARAKIDAQEAVLLHALGTDAPPPCWGGTPELDKGWVRDEVACALRIAPALAQAKLIEATQLVTRLPVTLSALGRGEIGARHANRLIEAILPLPDATAAAIEARVLPRAPLQTLGQFGASLRRAVLALDPRDQEQQQDAVADRRVAFTPQPNGVTELWALLPADTATALQAAIDQHADHAKTPEDARSADQRRADALIALALGEQPVKPVVNVTVALSTLLGLDTQPGELDGQGPIPAALARALAFDPTGTWRRLLTDPTGQVVDAGRTSYRPPTALARAVTARQTTCVFPGCRRRATRCHLDHIQPWTNGGETNLDNLQPICPRHHHLKHEAGWRVWRLPDGTTRWQTPSGHTHDRPPDEIPRDTTSDPPDERDDLAS